MNKTFTDAGKKILHDLLDQCTEPQQRMFKLMYGRDGGKRSVEDTVQMTIYDIVEQIEYSKIDWAISQCERTVQKNISTLVKQP